MPGADEALRVAAEGGNWMPVMIVMVMLVAFGGLAWLVKTYSSQAYEREKVQNKHNDDLNTFIRGEMKEVIDKNTQVVASTGEAMKSLDSTLRQRTCLLPKLAIEAAREAMEGENQK